MSRCFALLVVVASGCFYTDPINQRPSIAIHEITTGTPYRGQILNVEAISNDPDGDQVSVQWRAYACTDHGSCDTAPFDSSITKLAHFTIPMARSGGGSLETVYITLEGKDDFGAAAKPPQELFIDVTDRAPDLEVRGQAPYIVDMPIRVFAKVADLDDSPTNLMIDWTLSAPATDPTPGPLVDLSVMQDPNDLTHLQLGKIFTPHGLGDYTVQVTATDIAQLTASMPIPLHVVADHAPCLAQWDPAASQQTSQLIPINDATLFQILVVADDLDPFPSVPDGVIGQTEFHWSIVPPGGTRTPLTSVNGSGVALDPASYIPGDIVELRVEIEDRKHIAVNCPDTQLTCSVISDPTCTQRLTWRVEMQ